MKKSAIIHPFLLGMFPALFLYSHNADLTPASEVAIPLVVAVLLVLSLWAISYIIVRDMRRSGLIASLGVLLFFSYGQVHDLTGMGDSYMLILWVAVFASGALVVARRSRWDMRRLTVFVNAVSVVLVAVPSTTAAYHILSRDHYRLALPSGSEVPDERPDIYYIILDGYGRSDVLNDIYGYDNSGFTDYLKSKGFYVADSAISNYAQTPLSIASSLNFEYLDGLADCLGEGSSDELALFDMIHDNRVARFLRERGYKFAVFSSGYAATDVKEADLYLKPKWSFSEFQAMLAGFTPLPALLEALNLKDREDFYRDRILYILENLGNIPRTGEPVFVFAHITVPHNPFLFDEDGGHVDLGDKFPFGFASSLDGSLKTEYINGYRSQTAFVSREIKKTVDNILSCSHKPPVVIIQGDHGPGAGLDWLNPEKTDFRERMAILNAYLLPGPGKDALYSTISPVNSFRVVFNRYFGVDLPMLEDRIYFSTPLRPYQFVDVTGSLSSRTSSVQ